MPVKKSPFPGVDPYLERHWPSVHTQLVSGASRALNRLLPRDLVARPEERTSIGLDEESNFLHRVVPDARIFEFSESDAAVAATLTAPFKLVLESDPGIERYLKILNAADERLITVIEFVSPANKIGEGADAYLAKRNELIEGGVHVVEIDLVRRGNWRRLLSPHHVPPEAVAEFRASVRLAGQPAAVYLFPVSLRLPVPSIPIPLRKQDGPVTLDVQRLLGDVYADDRYGDTIDYGLPCTPELDVENEKWVLELLRSAGKR
jgi:hypothetical protein